MDKHQRDLRRAAAQAFLESLNNLEETLHVSAPPAVAPTVADPGTRPAPPPARPESTASARPAPPLESTRATQAARKRPALQPFSLADFEQAAADIERYMQARQANLSE